jgi:hypothetical protein
MERPALHAEPHDGAMPPVATREVAFRRRAGCPIVEIERTCRPLAGRHHKHQRFAIRFHNRAVCMCMRRNLPGFSNRRWCWPLPRAAHPLYPEAGGAYINHAPGICALRLQMNFAKDRDAVDIEVVAVSPRSDRPDGDSPDSAVGIRHFSLPPVAENVGAEIRKEMCLSCVTSGDVATGGCARELEARNTERVK